MLRGMVWRGLFQRHGMTRLLKFTRGRLAALSPNAQWAAVAN
jgi:hypothetical protein